MSVRLVTDSQIGDAVIRIVRDAKKKIVLVSPYNNHWGELEKELNRARRRGVRIIMHFRRKKNNLDPARNYRDVDSFPVDKLHAKIYANENTALVTSLNLTEWAAFNSREIGLLIGDANLCRQIDDYVRNLTVDDRDDDDWDDWADEDADDNAWVRRRNFNFEMLRIDEGERLTYKDNRRITCTVYQQDPPLVSYRRTIWSLSGLTKELKDGASVAGTLYWEYGGELLVDRRRRLVGD